MSPYLEANREAPGMQEHCERSAPILARPEKAEYRCTGVSIRGHIAVRDL